MKLRSGFLWAGAGVAAVLIGCGGGGGGGGSTVGNNATATSATATATSTNATSTTTTSTTTTATTTTATTSNPVGVLPKNKIFYDEVVGDSVQIRYLDPSGANDTLYATLGPNFSGFAPNPVVQNQFFFGARPTSGARYRLYRNASISLTNAANLTPNVSFDSLDQVQVANNGQFALFVASTGSGAPRLYYLNLQGALADPVDLDAADRFHIASASNQVVYSKTSNGRGAIFRRALPTGDPVLVTDEPSAEDIGPRFNKDASRVVFSSDRGGGLFDLYAVRTEGSDLQRITSTADQSEVGAAFNDAGDQVSYVSLGLISALARKPLTGERVVLKESNGLNDTSWTGSDGKFRASATARRKDAKTRVETEKKG